ncbi:MAG: DNA alkylation repair protein [Myxococcota bacterium]
MSGDGERKAFKDYFDRAAAKALAAQVHAVEPGFDRAKFVRQVTRGLEDKSFSERVQQFSDGLRALLPTSVPRALGRLVDSLPEPLPDCEAVTDGWLQWPIGQFIADHGLEHFEPSMEAMIALTQRFSSEFAVRPFVEQRPKETFARLRTLTDHDSPHVRRWCSEGVRPRLPWGKVLRALVEDPRPICPILDALKDDPERYVVRSVANNINDIAKDHPEAAVARCKRWGLGRGERRRWLINHALRSRIKAGDPAALEIVGFGAVEKLTAKLQIVPAAVHIGDSVEMTLTLRSGASKAQPVMIDYAVHYVRSRGTTSGKVFKWTRATLEPSERTVLTKKHAMRPTTVRTLFPGTHRVVVQANGHPVAESSFELMPAKD